MKTILRTLTLAAMVAGLGAMEAVVAQTPDNPDRKETTRERENPARGEQPAERDNPGTHGSPDVGGIAEMLRGARGREGAVHHLGEAEVWRTIARRARGTRGIEPLVPSASRLRLGGVYDAGRSILHVVGKTVSLYSIRVSVLQPNPVPSASYFTGPPFLVNVAM
jgi:hypothetical protein